ncbi:MAG TPA: SdpI family protein [Terriglobales bacterium]|nr:SdpI family protein [Terriglobales bacterium]
MKNKTTLFATTAVCLAPMALAAVYYSQLPERMVIHFSAAGVPDNYASKAFVCFGLPALMALLNLVVHLIVNADPKKAGGAPVMIAMGKWVIPVVCIFLMPVTIFYALGRNVNVSTIVPMFIGLVFIAIGNYLPKCRQNYTVGIKLPWTLASEENWRRTHRFGGVTFILGGVIMLAAGFLPDYFTGVIAAVLALTVGAPAVYSYSMYKRGI